MRLRRLALRGLTRFTAAEPVSIDFDALGPGLIALVGPNGAGKTTVLEAVIAALYRSFPSRPGWYEHCHGRDSFVEVLFEDGGAEIKVRTQIDAERRTTEQHVFVDGRPVTTGRAAEAVAEIERRFGSLDLLLASVVSAQNRAGSFLLMAKGDRKALFAELLGLGRLEVLHQASRDRRAAAESELVSARDAVARLEARLAGKADTEATLQAAQERQESAAGRLATAQQEEAAATSALERARTSAERLAALRSARDAAATALGDADQALKDAIASGTAARQEAARRRHANETQATDVEAQERRANERHATAVRALDTRRAALEAALAERPVLEEAHDRISALEAELGELDVLDQSLRSAVAEQKLAEGASIAARRRVADAEARVEDDRTRLAGEAKLLDRVPCAEAEKWMPMRWDAAQHPKEGDLAGTCPLLKSAQDAKGHAAHLQVDPSLVVAAAAAQQKLDAAIEVVTEAAMACDPIRAAAITAELPALRQKVARLSVLDRTAQDLRGLGAELERANAEKSRELKDAATRRDRLAAEASTIEDDLKNALAAALGRETSARGRVEQARDRALAAAREFQAVASDGTTIPAADAALSAARQARISAQRDLSDADRAHATAEAAMDALREFEAAVPAAMVEVAEAGGDVGAWVLLEQALGRDGIQALEIDAAGPEVARICNDLLEVWPGGPRFSISFETLRAKKDGKGSVEAFEVQVRDRGHERPVEALSGGERVVIGEAIGLAIAILNARKNSIRWQTLVRDETSGALDPANAQAYVEMLRRALSLGGFRNVIFVAHQPEVVERADVRLIVADGRVTIEGATRAVPAGAAA